MSRKHCGVNDREGRVISVSSESVIYLARVMLFLYKYGPIFMTVTWAKSQKKTKLTTRRREGTESINQSINQSNNIYFTVHKCMFKYLQD